MGGCGVPVSGAGGRGARTWTSGAGDATSGAFAVLESLPAFEGLDGRDWTAMLPHTSICEVERGADLALAESAGAVIVLRGALSPWLEDGSGPELTMPAAGPGGFVEYATALGLPLEQLIAETRLWRARSPARLLRLDAALFEQQNPFAARLLYALSRSLATALRRTTGLAMHFRMAWVRGNA